MLKNHLKVALRNLLKNRMFSVINLLGLAVGLAAFWMIGLFILDELTYDRFHEKSDRIYRVVHSANWDNGHFDLAITSAPFAPTLKKDYPEIQETVRFSPEGGGPIRVGDKQYTEKAICFTDANVFEVFDFPFLYGNPKTALSKPKSIVLTEGMAKKLFGDAKRALNQTVYLENNYENLVTGVIKDAPTHSHLHFKALRSLPADYTDGWQNFSIYTYLLLKPHTHVASLEKKLTRFFPDHLQKEMGNVDYKLHLQPLTDIHLYSHLDYEISANGDVKYIIVFSIIAVLILLIAAINYMNLSTAHSALRVREVGVRKAIGSDRNQLVSLFLAESIILTLAASLLGILIVELSLPFFNDFSGKELSLWQLGVLPTLALLLVFCLIMGGLSGSYPAFFLSGFRTIPALKGQLGNTATNKRFRQSLVVFQFMVTISMLIGSAVIYQQMHYTSSKDLGFNRNQVLTFHVHKTEVRKQIPQLKDELLKNPLIEGVSAAGNPIGNNDLGGKGFYFENNGEISESSVITKRIDVDEDFLNTLEMKLVAGRNFDKSRKTDLYESVLVNETLVKKLGWKNPIGKRVEFNAGQNNEIRGHSQVVGVVKDFHVYSLQHTIEPLVMQMPLDFQQDNLYVRIRPENTQATLAYIEKVYQKFDPDHAFEYSFLDQNFAHQYEAEIKQGRLLVTFTLLTIFIACLGLFGLVTFTAEQRTKEIGIRKVLGASVTSIVGMISKDFMILIGIASLIAFPMAWYTMHRWLEDFAYRIELQGWVFLAAAGVALLIALITISTQAIRAALANPVKSLKSE
ncbi:ABC transporter permease [Siphonobacter sp. SORGH_AS_1065]|uniref:ABC transporter permease n=1 Tax=Siphonobacter sp. SORGH_AS_1065 TaxID=3041795 RepID=UPI0027896F15|nr:ABC transporter permease [Siphonobacter sp. SORGH_AS_1065]MDQ1085823.1 putative ABC transport system permease protein [Siphonobacter sp. SORGH_AS_1065]